MLATMGYPTHHGMPSRSKYTSTFGVASKSMHSMPMPTKPMARQTQSQPVDAGELARRLIVVRAERKAQSDRRRRQRAAEENASRSNRSKDVETGTPDAASRRIFDQPERDQEAVVDENSVGRIPLKLSSVTGDTTEQLSGYRHVPCVAASQFARTTTAEVADQGPIHKLAMRRAQSTRERQPARSSSQESRSRATSGQETGLHRSWSVRHTASSRVKQATGEEDGNGDKIRRKSTGGIIARAKSSLVDPLEMVSAMLAHEKPEIVGNPNDHRVDWTQNDEEMMTKGAPPSPPRQPELRKMESRWMLRGRLGSLGRHARDEKPPSPPDEAVLQEVFSKAGGGGFFSRFKRQP